MVLVLNIAFLALSFLSTFVSQGLMAERVRHAFATNELIDRDYLPYDSHRGFHQYNDCNILQMITNSDSSRAGRAWGPWILGGGSLATSRCRVLRELVVDERGQATFVASRYTRYWHGYIPVVSALSTIMDIATLRAVLRASVYASVLLLFLAGVWRRSFLLLTTPIATAAGLFWGLPFFGQGLSHSLGDLVVMIGLGCLVLWHRPLGFRKRQLLFCAGFGGVVVYFDMLTGALPVAAGFLFPTVYLMARLSTPHLEPGGHIRQATFALAAFALGGALTIATKLAVSAVLVRPDGVDVFFANLAFYTQRVDYELPVPSALQPLGRLLRQGRILTHGSNWGLMALYGSAAVAWLASLRLAAKRGNRLAWADFAAFAIGAASIPAWSVLMPTHTFVHAGFMARILIVPIALGWAAWLSQLHRQPLGGVQPASA